MRTLTKNKRKMYYAKYLGKEKLVDPFGYATGEEKSLYGAVCELFANISAGNGSKETDAFGETAIYDRIILTYDINIDIGEDDVFWIDCKPDNVPYDYVVKAVTRGINGVFIAVKRVVR